jgi:mono/diheme cytochrome c family protein
MKLKSIAKIKVFTILIFVLLVPAILTITPKRHMTIAQAGDGAGVYASYCARCHGADGRGQTAKGKQTGAKDFTSAKWQPNEARGIRVITNGKGKMPSFKNTLSAEDIRAAWTYIKGRFK